MPQGQFTATDIDKPQGRYTNADVDVDPWEANKSTFFKEHPFLGDVFKATGTIYAPELGLGLATRGGPLSTLATRVPNPNLESMETEGVQALRAGKKFLGKIPLVKHIPFLQEAIGESEPIAGRGPNAPVRPKPYIEKMTRFRGSAETSESAPSYGAARRVLRHPEPEVGQGASKATQAGVPKELDDIAIGQAGKKFAHLTEKQQEGAMRIYKDMQAKGGATSKPSSSSGPASTARNPYIEQAQEFKRARLTPTQAKRTLERAEYPPDVIARVLEEMRKIP